MAYRLRIAFDDPDTFRAELERNIAMGGAFVPTGDLLELRTFVDLVIELSFCDQSVVLEAEVVHVIPPEHALNPGDVGVAVSFRKPASELRAMFKPYLNEEVAGLPEPTETLDERKTTPDDGSDVDLPMVKPVSSPSYPPCTRFELFSDRIDPAKLSDLEASVIELVEAGLEVSRMLDVIPEKSADVYRTIHELIEGDVMKIRGAD